MCRTGTNETGIKAWLCQWYALGLSVRHFPSLDAICKMRIMLLTHFSKVLWDRWMKSGNISILNYEHWKHYLCLITDWCPEDKSTKSYLSSNQAVLDIGIKNVFLFQLMRHELSPPMWITFWSILYCILVNIASYIMVHTTPAILQMWVSLNLGLIYIWIQTLLFWAHL